MVGQIIRPLHFKVRNGHDQRNVVLKKELMHFQLNYRKYIGEYIHDFGICKDFQRTKYKRTKWMYWNSLREKTSVYQEKNF